jgi:hypothetical protein
MQHTLRPGQCTLRRDIQIPAEQPVQRSAQRQPDEDRQIRAEWNAMKKVPNNDPITVAITVHIKPAPMLNAVAPVAIAVRLMLPTNQIAPRSETTP